MKQVILALMAYALLCTPMSAKKKEQQKDLWPDGTEISQWFKDTAQEIGRASCRERV